MLAVVVAVAEGVVAAANLRDVEVLEPPLPQPEGVEGDAVPTTVVSPGDPAIVTIA